MRMRGVLFGAAIGTAAGITASKIGQWRRTWGIEPGEVERPLPGDDIVPSAMAGETRGITIDAGADVVWPWLAQLGQDRGGFYSFDLLENVVGCRMDADRGRAAP